MQSKCGAQTFFDAQVYLAPTPVSPFVRSSHFFGFPFCQRRWALTKRRADIVVADMVADMAADMEVQMCFQLTTLFQNKMVADIEVDKVADMVADIFITSAVYKAWIEMF